MDWTIELADGFADVGDGAHVSIIIDPAHRRVTDYHVSIGARSWPWSVYHGTQLMVRVPRNSVTDSVVAILREHEDTLEAIARAYDGERWDGREFVGEWGEDGRPVCEIADLTHALEYVARRWRADEWVHWVLVAMGWREIARAICPMALETGWQAATDAFLAEDRSEGIRVATDDAARELRDGFGYYLDEIADEIDDLDDADEIAEIVELRDLIRRALAI